MPAFPRCSGCRRPIRDRKMLRNPKTGKVYHLRHRPGSTPRRVRRNVFGFHPVTGPIRRRLAARKLRKAGFSPERAKALAATKNPSGAVETFFKNRWNKQGRAERVRIGRIYFEPDVAVSFADRFPRWEDLPESIREYIVANARDFERQVGTIPRNPSKFWASKAIRHPGGLTRYGYSESGSEASRHKALCKLVKKEGYATAIRRLLWRSNVAHSRVASADMGWLQRVFAASNPAHYPVNTSPAFRAKFERLVMHVKAHNRKYRRQYNPRAVATAVLGARPPRRGARLATRNPSPYSIRHDKVGYKGRHWVLTIRSGGEEGKTLFFRTKRAAIDFVSTWPNPSRRVRRRLAVLRSRERSFARKHRRAAKFARRGGRFAAGFAKGAFPEIARPSAGLKAGYEAARRNPANKTAAHYLDLARSYLAKGAFRTADDFIIRAQRAASPDSRVYVEAMEMRGRLHQAMLDREPGGLGRMWERAGRNPQVDGAEAVEIVYREPNGQLWRHRFGELTGNAPLVRVRKGSRSDRLSIGPTKVTRRGVTD